jgi:hypothetical protein
MTSFKKKTTHIAKGNTSISATIAGEKGFRGTPSTNQLVFKDSCQFLSMPLSAMPKAFDFKEMKKGYYPYYLNQTKFYGQVLDNLPDKRYYNYEFMKSSARKEFDIWYNTNREKQFDCDEEIIRYCESDVKILKTGVQKVHFGEFFILKLD